MTEVVFDSPSLFMPTSFNAAWPRRSKPLLAVRPAGSTGTQHVGVVNRVNKRATVLVEDAKGMPYSNGKRYSKFYVPVQMLEKAE